MQSAQAPKLPPGPSSRLIAMVRYLRDPYRSIADPWKKYGDPFTVPTFSGPIVITGDPEGVKQFFGADADQWVPVSVEAMQVLLGPGSLLLMTGAQHKSARKLLMPPFHGARMRAYGNLMRELTLARAAEIPTGKPFSLQETTQAISLDVILGAVFGVHDRERMRALHEAIVALIAAVRPSFVLWKSLQREFGGIGPYARFRRCMARTRELIFAEIERKRAAAENGEDILTLLLEARYEDGQPIGDDELYDQLFTLVIAGHETTAITLAFACDLLLRAPDALERLRAELDGAGDDPETIAKLPFLDAVCSETLRIYPLVPIVSRRTTRPWNFMGRDYPAGVGFGVATSLVHRREDLYPEPEKFRPERFLERSYSAFEFFPFGGGHRRCVGAAFAVYEMKIALAALLSRHRFRLAGDEPLRLEARAATIGPRGGVRMILDERC
jgi:cytochrome P450